MLLVFFSFLGAQGTCQCWVLLFILLLGVHGRAGIFPLTWEITEHWLDVRVSVGGECCAILALALPCQ